jgi:ethanolamine ammonia-lyase small subunit
MSFDLERARRTTPARLGVGRTGTRPPTAAWLRFQADHAAARDAVWSTWSAAFHTRLEQLGFLHVASAAPDRLAYLREPALGRRLADGERARIAARGAIPDSILIVLSDGLSARAGEAQLERVYPALRQHLAQLGALAAPVAVHNGRVAIADEIGAAAAARLVVHLIGERPGLGTPDSLGCYITLAPAPTTTDADRKCISNIRDAGLSPAEAGTTIAGLCRRILAAGTSGTELVL